MEPSWPLLEHGPPPRVTSKSHSQGTSPFPLHARRCRGIFVHLFKGPLKETARANGELTNDPSCSFLPSQQPGGRVALINQLTHVEMLTQMAPAVTLSHVNAGDKWHGLCWPAVPVGRAEMDACVPLCDGGVNHDEE